MTQEQIRLVQQSWELVKPIAKDAAHLFYDKLFTAAPNIRHLFKEDISEQAGKLAMMLNFVVSKLHRIDDIAEDVKKLGASHNRYGARPEHYDVVGSCLIATLKQGLGIHWNAELEKAWVAAFTILKNAMIEAQHALAENTAKYKPVPSD
jgi:hemoglobin-like flavoprotein